MAYKPAYSFFELAAAFLLVMVLGYSGMVKLLNFREFTTQLTNFPHLNAAPVFWAATLCAASLLSCCLLCVPRTRLPGFFTASLLLMIITAYLVWMVMETTVQPCSCGGMLANFSWHQQILLNIMLIMVSGMGIRSNICANRNCRNL